MIKFTYTVTLSIEQVVHLEQLLATDRQRWEALIPEFSKHPDCRNLAANNAALCKELYELLKTAPSNEG